MELFLSCLLSQIQEKMNVGFMKVGWVMFKRLKLGVPESGYSSKTDYKCTQYIMSFMGVKKFYNDYGCQGGPSEAVMAFLKAMPQLDIEFQI